MAFMLFLDEDVNGVLLRVRVQPRAAKNQITGVCNGALRLRLTAPPVAGEANEACRAFFAQMLKVPRSQVELVSGRTSRNKLLRIRGVTKENIKKLLSVHI